jgi:hypothetical protein
VAMRIPLPLSRRERIGAAFVTLAHVPEKWEPVFPQPTYATPVGPGATASYAQWPKRLIKQKHDDRREHAP